MTWRLTSRKTFRHVHDVRLSMQADVTHREHEHDVTVVCYYRKQALNVQVPLNVSGTM